MAHGYSGNGISAGPVEWVGSPGSGLVLVRVMGFATVPCPSLSLAFSLAV